MRAIHQPLFAVSTSQSRLESFCTDDESTTLRRKHLSAVRSANVYIRLARIMWLSASGASARTAFELSFSVGALQIVGGKDSTSNTFPSSASRTRSGRHDSSSSTDTAGAP